METVILRVRAPFAAFRWMQAGVFRGTTPVIPHSAAWGLALNLAGIETRGEMSGVTTARREDAPTLRIAVGVVSRDGDDEGPRTQRATLYQQLHTYPVGNSGREFEKGTHGAKYWIAPTRREFVVDYDGVIAVASDDLSIHERMRAGLAGTLDGTRYGLPFAGDNNFLFDDIAIVDEAPLSWWYTPMKRGDAPREGSCRLTIGIDRRDSSRTTTMLFAPDLVVRTSPPDTAWVRVPG